MILISLCELCKMYMCFTLINYSLRLHQLKSTWNKPFTRSDCLIIPVLLHGLRLRTQVVQAATVTTKPTMAKRMRLCLKCSYPCQTNIDILLQSMVKLACSKTLEFLTFSPIVYVTVTRTLKIPHTPTP